MDDKLSIGSLIGIFFKVMLGRDAADEEIQYFAQRYRRGFSIGHIVTDIFNSKEAKQYTIDKTFGSMTVAEASAVAINLNSSMLVSVDDVMNTIAEAFERHDARPPTFQDVYDQYSDMRGGKSLASVLGTIARGEATRQIATPEEGRQDSRERFTRFMEVVYRRCLMRPISPVEVDIWLKHVRDGVSHADILVSVDNSDEAKAIASSQDVSDLSAGTFIQLVFELLLKRGATPRDVSSYRDMLNRKEISRQHVLAQFFAQAARATLNAHSESPVNDPTRASLFGRPEQVTVAHWDAKAAELREAVPRQDAERDAPTFSRFLFTSTRAPLVTIITSLYRGGRFIERFLDNITSQSIFGDHCELLIIDANSPDGELETAGRFLRRFPNIKYKRCDTRIGIYEAWNIGVAQARGAYCTNANLDDLRRRDSCELQASTLDALPFADVVYQDVLYSFSSETSFDEIAQHGFSTHLPIVSRYNLMEFNLPHNGPMWRKSLHDEVGLFNAAYKSAGDFDFWIRCLARGKTFYKLNDPHIAYYVNPEGLSTRIDTPGLAESHLTSLRYYREIVSPNLTVDDVAFAREVGYDVTAEASMNARYDLAQAALRRVSIASRAS